MPKPFKVHLRSKPINNNQLSLYLDFGRPVWHAVKNKFTRRDYLGLYIFAKPKTKGEREHNRNVNELAERRRSETLLAIQNNTYGAIDSAAETERKRGELDFYEFFESRMNQRKGASRKNYRSTLFHLKIFSPELKVKDLTSGFLLNFRDYLETEAEAQNRNVKLSQNSKYQYTGRLKTVLYEAYKRKLFTTDLSKELDNFSVDKPQRPFFLDEEVKKLHQTPFSMSPDLKKASLFSILTSLRFSDIFPLRYEMIQYDKTMGYYIDFKIKKVNCPDILYLSEEALKVCEYEKHKVGRIFLLRYWEPRILPVWFKAAGVKVPTGIKFHIFRHTFAVRALNKGTRIEEVSAMMGHKSIATTQIYAKLLATAKRDAMHKVTLGT